MSVNVVPLLPAGSGQEGSIIYMAATGKGQGQSDGAAVTAYMNPLSQCTYGTSSTNRVHLWHQHDAVDSIFSA